MKRHLALQPISRDHHGALILSRLLQLNAPAYKSLPLDVPGKSLYAVRFYEEHLIPHFRDEETAFEFAKGKAATLDQLIASVSAEHKALHSMFQSLRAETATHHTLDDIGRLLESHIRKEERELFPMMENYCDEETLQRIAAAHSTHS